MLLDGSIESLGLFLLCALLLGSIVCIAFSEYRNNNARTAKYLMLGAVAGFLFSGSRLLVGFTIMIAVITLMWYSMNMKAGVVTY